VVEAQSSLQALQRYTVAPCDRCRLTTVTAIIDPTRGLPSILREALLGFLILSGDTDHELACTLWPPQK
jgi:hypothetical protein